MAIINGRKIMIFYIRGKQKFETRDLLHTIDKSAKYDSILLTIVKVVIFVRKILLRFNHKLFQLTRLENSEFHTHFSLFYSPL